MKGERKRCNLRLNKKNIYPVRCLGIANLVFTVSKFLRGTAFNVVTSDPPHISIQSFKFEFINA